MSAPDYDSIYRAALARYERGNIAHAATMNQLHAEHAKAKRRTDIACGIAIAGAIIAIAWWMVLALLVPGR